MNYAITREPAATLAACELTFLDRSVIDYENALLQHEAYRSVLKALGLQVVCLPALDDLPDSTFVEDTAVLLPEIAVITNPGAESRRGESQSNARVLSDYREIEVIRTPATIDGGDVLTVGKRCFVGITSRTNRAGFEALSAIVRPLGYTSTAVETKDSLHLKTAITAVSDDTLLVNPQWLDTVDFTGFRILESREAFGANVLRIGDSVVVHEGFTKTNEMLRMEGFDLKTVNISEFLKAEAGLTCLSIVF
jgi:dimethylargininase